MPAPNINRRVILNTGGGADRWASMPAPAGYRWVFVTYLGQGVTYLGEPAVALESING
jgi:hypothetical protein